MDATDQDQQDDGSERTVSHIYKTVGISFLDIRTQNESLRACLTQAERAARSDVTVMLLVWHTGGVAVLSAIAGATGRLFLNWRSIQ